MPVQYHCDHEGVVTLTLDRPELHNPVSAILLDSFHNALDRLEKEASARIVILAANGMSFLTGYDNDWLEALAAGGESSQREAVEKTAALLKRIDRLPLPVIARIQGSAFGLGGGIVACCDYVVATEAALFGFSEARLGWIPAEIAPYIVRAVGVRLARRYFMTGERFNAVRAKKIGLVDKVVVEDHELDYAIANICRLLRQNSPAAMGKIKHLMSEIDLEISEKRLDDLILEQSLSTRMSEEGRHGLQAFIERRNPRWFGQD